jgi:signal transduction histidine kinase
MRRRLAHSLKQKLMLVILLTTGVALFFAFAAHALLQYFTTRNELLQVASSMAEVVAANSTAALTFDDPRAAQQTLSSLRIRPSIVAACLYAPSGAVFSTYHRRGAEGDPVPPTPGSDGHLFGGGNLVLFRPVMLDGERVGTVYLKMELTEVVQQQIRYAGMILLFLAGSGLVALLVASRLQRIVSGPILGLADAARSVSESRDYSVRVPVQAEDEIGSLSAAFNTMLGRIETDAAALQAAQHDLKAKVQDLEREVSERVEAEEALKLSEEQLIQAQKMEAIGRLAGGVAHDFNNLLTVINGYSELLLLEMGENDPIRPTIAEIRKAGERAAGLTRQLLAFGRKQMIAPRIIDLNAVIENTQAMLRRLIGEDIALEVTLDPGVMRVKADPSQVDQLILNLAVNARDAMPQGGALSIETANVTLKESPPRSPEILPGPYIAIRIVDTGCGMDVGTMAHIFEP